MRRTPSITTEGTKSIATEDAGGTKTRKGFCDVESRISVIFASSVVIASVLSVCSVVQLGDLLDGGIQ